MLDLPDTPENEKRKIAWIIESVTPDDTGADVDELTRRIQQEIALLSYLDVDDFLLPLTEARYNRMVARFGASMLRQKITDLKQRRTA